MKKLLRILVKSLVYLGTALVILLAVAVGLFRLFLPKLPEYQEEIKQWANAAVGMQVEFSGMDARWRFRGPELNFYDAELVSRDDSLTVLHAEEVRVGVGLMRLLLDRELVADRILIRETTIDVERDSDGTWRVQGIATDTFTDSRMASTDRARPLTVVGQDVLINFKHPDRPQPVLVVVDTVEFQRDEMQHGFDASLVLPPELGNRIEVAASQRLAGATPRAPWQVFVEGRAVNVAGLFELLPKQKSPALASGMADVSLWLDVAAGEVRSATANFAATRIVADSNADIAPFGMSGRVEYTTDLDGWLVSADDFIVRTPDGAWPQSALQLRVLPEQPGTGATVAGSASYFNLDDIGYVLAWVPEEQRELLKDLAPSGVMRNLDFSVARRGGAPGRTFELTVEMDSVGVAAYDKWPGIRGFSGTVRADNSGGRLEMQTGDMKLELAGHLLEPVDIVEADGTIIWRQSDGGTTLLSDSIRVRNADFDSTSSLQLTVPAGDASPVVDLQSNWSFRDIGSVERYLPINLLKPALYRWLTDALVAGHIPRGTTRFTGPLDKFPFDNGEGSFRVDARLENGTLKYSDSWPVAADMNLDVAVENTHLWSARNSATNAGNSVVDARIDIPDLRRPVLSIEGRATGTLETIRRFSRESPIAGVFGGQLDRVTTSGPASFDLLLTLPILDRQDFEFTARIRSESGTLHIEGMPSPISELNGLVTVTRDSVSADSLSGVFLDGPVTIDLERREEANSAYSIVASAGGSITAEGLATHFDEVLSELLTGRAAYDATVRFPRMGGEPGPLSIEVRSDLDGMAVNMPPPIGKAATDERPVSFSIELPGEGRIESSGNLADDVRWALAFARSDQGWDFDRGMLALGGAAPGKPEVRGLHVEGRTTVLDLDDWLELSRLRVDSGGPGFAERIRSIDVVVDDLYVIGQHLAQHRVIVNRSALDWAVKLDGEHAIGSLNVPYDFRGDRPLTLDMTKLVLPGGDEDASGNQRRPDPRALPQIIVGVEDFTLGERHLGSLAADFRRTGNGLEAVGIETSNDTFDIRGRAGWIVDESDASGQRSYVAARLTSSNVQQTLRSLDHDVGIQSESLDAQFDVSWSGGPRQDFLASLDGTVNVRFGKGQLDEVEPGAGRVFGLMSIVALPRRLSLDFRDVFDKGFGFDEITGTFRLDNGEAYTCDLSLKGPAADVGIVGRAGLLARDYDQAAVVSANVGNTLPVVGAVVAGPQVAAALLIFSQIFKKPLQEMGQVYYGIQGDWSDPVIENSNPQRFAETSTTVGCLEGA